MGRLSRIFMLGFEIPGLDSRSHIEAMGYRTWQITQSLLADNHKVYLCARHLRRTEHPVAPVPKLHGNLEYERVDFRDLRWTRRMNRRLKEFNPDCIIAVGSLCSILATKLHTSLPIWMDIYGDNLAEHQLSMAALRSDRGRLASIWFDRKILKRGDVFSVCSTPQKYALVGRLAAVGRLSRYSVGYEFVYVVMPGAFNQTVTGKQLLVQESNVSFLRANGKDSDDFLVLWCGSYNTWSDLDTLFSGLSIAMESNPRIVYLSVGNPTVSEDEHRRFWERVSCSPYRDRFRMLGRIPHNENWRLYQKCDCGVSTDKAVYEAQLGTRTRLVEMIAAGLPVVTSELCELSHMLSKSGVALTYPAGDSLAFAAQLIKLSRDDELRSRLSKAGKDFVGRELSSFSTTAVIREWLQSPKRAPDYKLNRRIGFLGRIRFIARALAWIIRGQISQGR